MKAGAAAEREGLAGFTGPFGTKTGALIAWVGRAGAGVGDSGDLGERERACRREDGEHRTAGKVRRSMRYVSDTSGERKGEDVPEDGSRYSPCLETYMI